MPQKGIKFNWREKASVELFGVSRDKQVNKEKAQEEVFWKNTGQTPGCQIWRISGEKLVVYPIEEYGKFFSADSYVILYTHQESSGDLTHHVHFWVGKYSDPIEYSTAAFKMVELDAYHDGKLILHREVQGKESDDFMAYFEFYTVMKGNFDSDFLRVGPEGYSKRLFQVAGEDKVITVTEIAMKKGNLNSDDVFILDCGLRIFQYNGETASKDEKFRAMQYVTILRSVRMSKPKLNILDQISIGPNNKFYRLIPEGQSKEKEETDNRSPKEILKVAPCDSAPSSSSSGADIKFSDVCKGVLDRSKLTSKDVFVLNSGSHVFGYIGKDAPAIERRNAITYCHYYLKEHDNPFLPITIVSQGQKSKAFDKAFVEEEEE